MRDKVYYYDHSGMLRLTLNEWPYYTDPSDFKDWSWGYDDQFGRLNTFRRNKTNWELTIGIAVDSKEAHDALCDIFTADILAGKPGRLVLRGWSLQCYIVEAQYAYGLLMDRQVRFDVRAVDSTWTRSKSRVLASGAGGEIPEGDGRWRDYIRNRGYKPTDHKYGYNVANEGKAYFALTGGRNGYVLEIIGPVTNPTVYLNNHPITVNVTVNTGQTLRIESNGEIKTIELISQSGLRENVFNLRDKVNSPFVELGDSVVLTYGDINVTFTTIERRSEPTWT